MVSSNFIDSSIAVFLKHPKLIIPIFLSWIIFFILFILSFFLIGWKISNLNDLIFPLFMYYFLFATLTSIACSMLLEMIEQIENKESPSLLKSFKTTLSENLNDMLPIIFVWSLLWAGITVIELIFSKAKQYGKSRYYSRNIEGFEDISKALEFFNGNFSFTTGAIFFEIIKRGLKMTAMMSFCAIAWDNLGYYDATKKAFRAIQSDFTEFASGFINSAIIIIVIFIPPVLAIYLVSQGYAHFHLRNLIFLVVYVLCGLSYAIYMEQLFIGQFYMWYRKWEVIAIKSLEANRQPPPMEDIPVPSLLDNINDLKKGAL